jgi:hypothetical protein
MSNRETGTKIRKDVTQKECKKENGKKIRRSCGKTDGRDWISDDPHTM